jgi:hypothetical protein
MAKLRWAHGPRALAFSLLLAGAALGFPQGAAAQQRGPTLDQALGNAGTWLGAHMAPETTTILLSFSAPNPGLSSYCSEKFIAGMQARGAGSVVQLEGDLLATDVRNVSRNINVETIVIGSIARRGSGYQLVLRTTDGKTGRELGRMTAAIGMDKTMAALLGEADPSASDDPNRAAVMAALRNPLFGLGSYAMGDMAGGAIVTGGYGISLVFAIWGIIGIAEGDSHAGVPLGVGVGIAGATTIFGIFRPLFFYDSLPRSKVAAVLDGVNIAIIPGAAGIKAVRMSYSLTF